MRNRRIGRARMFMGALLLLAAALTWSIGLMMSPHGETVARGTEYLRAAIVTFKRNGAIGTLILCAVAAWLLFPRRRPKWPMRDWALIVLFAFLAGSSIYTLIWLRPSVPNNADVDANSSTVDMNMDWDASSAVVSGMEAGSVNPAPTLEVNRTESGGPRTVSESNERGRADNQTQSEHLTEEPAEVPEERADAQGNLAHGDASEPPNNEIDENEEQVRQPPHGNALKPSAAAGVTERQLGALNVRNGSKADIRPLARERCFRAQKTEAKGKMTIAQATAARPKMIDNLIIGGSL